MDLRERRVAQIVRDFMEAYALSRQIGEGLQSDALRSSNTFTLRHSAREKKCATARGAV